MKTKVRVKRAELLKVVDGRVLKAQREWERARDSYPDKLKAWESGCVERLRKALAAAEKGKLPVDRYGSVRLTFTDPPTKPSEGRELCHLRRMQATLRMGSDTTLLLSQDDADDYFGPCTL
jgi:hypothetical protein